MRADAILFLFPFLVAQAVEVKNLGMRTNLKENTAPNIQVQSNEVLGTCDGKGYTKQSELDGCIRNVAARAPTFLNPLNPSTSTISKPVSTNEEK